MGGIETGDEPIFQEMGKKMVRKLSFLRYPQRCMCFKNVFFLQFLDVVVEASHEEDQGKARGGHETTDRSLRSKDEGQSKSCDVGIEHFSCRLLL